MMKYFENIFDYPVYALSRPCDVAKCYGRRLQIRVCRARGCEHYRTRKVAEERLMMHRHRLRAAPPSSG